MADERGTGREGDDVKLGRTATAKVVKVKPDGTRVMRRPDGTLDEDKNPKKKVERPTER